VNPAHDFAGDRIALAFDGQAVEQPQKVRVGGYRVGALGLQRLGVRLLRPVETLPARTAANQRSAPRSITVASKPSLLPKCQYREVTGTPAAWQLADTGVAA